MKTAAAKTVATQTSLGSAGSFMRISVRAGSGLAGSNLGFACGPASDYDRSRVSAKVADVVRCLAIYWQSQRRRAQAQLIARAV